MDPGENRASVRGGCKKIIGGRQNVICVKVDVILVAPRQQIADTEFSRIAEAFKVIDPNGDARDGEWSCKSNQIAPVPQQDQKAEGDGEEAKMWSAGYCKSACKA